MYITSASYYYEFNMGAAEVFPRSPPPLQVLVPIETGPSFVNTAWMIRNDGADTAWARLAAPGKVSGGGGFEIPAGTACIIEWTEVNGLDLSVVGGPFLTIQGVLMAQTTAYSSSVSNYAEGARSTT